MINTITTVLEALTTFPDRPNYTSSSAYGAAVAQWLKENKELSETLAVLIPALNTMISQVNSTVEGLNTIDEDVIQNKEDIEAIAVAVEVLKDETILIKNLAEKWANQNEDIVVENGKYSAMHWALKAYAAVATLPAGTINDLLIETNKTWSSFKIDDELSGKASASSVELKLNSINPLITGSITEQVYNLTGTQINPANGTIQYKTVSANTTFTVTLMAGQSVILRLISAHNKTIKFPAITWVGVIAPVLTANCVIVLWKEQTTLYGAYIGSLA